MWSLAKVEGVEGHLDAPFSCLLRGQARGRSLGCICKRLVPAATLCLVKHRAEKRAGTMNSSFASCSSDPGGILARAWRVGDMFPMQGVAWVATQQGQAEGKYPIQRPNIPLQAEAPSSSGFPRGLKSMPGKSMKWAS